MARQLLVLVACAARVALGRLGSGSNVTLTGFCGKQGDVCAEGTGCKCDDHGSCACTQRCGKSGTLCDYGQECSCDDHGSCQCVAHHTDYCGKQGDVCAEGTGCKCDDHGSCACTQRCGKSGTLCDYGQECSCDDHGSCQCVDKPTLALGRLGSGSNLATGGRSLGSACAPTKEYCETQGNMPYCYCNDPSCSDSVGVHHCTACPTGFKLQPATSMPNAETICYSGR